MRLRVRTASIFVLGKNDGINLILKRRLLNANINYKLLRFRVFKQLWMNNRIALNIIDGKE